MNLRDLLPAPFPNPPVPGRLFSREVDEEVDEVEPRSDPDEEFKGRLRSEGFDPELIGMGLKVADNHSRNRKEALKIGENYIREMAK